MDSRARLLALAIGAGLVLAAPALADAAAPPTRESPPVLSGRPVPGATLHVSTGTWSQDPSPGAGPLTYSYQWLSCYQVCVTPIPGATAATYRIRRSDWGRGLNVKVTATDNFGSAYQYSNALVVPPPVVTRVIPPWPWISPDPLLITPPKEGFCLGEACVQESVSRLLRRGGFSTVLRVKKRGRLEVRWIARRRGKSVTIGSERAVFRRPGRYRTRFVLTRVGRALLREKRTFGFSIVAWFYERGGRSGCIRSGRVSRARRIVILPRCGS